MKLTFRMPIDYDKEDGYRQLEVIITTPQNYTTVVVRQKWNVCENDDETGTYTEGQTDLFLRYYHDSCWTEGICDCLRTKGIDIKTNYNSWYELVDIDFDISDLKEINKLSEIENLVFKFQ